MIAAAPDTQSALVGIHARLKGGRKPKVVLCYPPVVMQDRYHSIARWVTVVPQGMAILAAVLREQGFEVACVDSVAEKLTRQEVLKRVLDENPDVVGFSSTTLVVTNAARIAGALKQARPDIVTLVGGAHFSAVPVETLNRFPEFDLGVVGEGEFTLPELLNTFVTGGDLANVKGLVYREEGEPVFTPRRELVQDMDSLPMPAWDLFPDLPKYYQHVTVRIDRVPSASLLISRGCLKGECTFCARDFYSSKTRIHSPQRALEMIRHLQENYGIKSINFEDEDLLIFRKVLKQFCQLLIDEKVDITWAISGRVDVVKPDLLELMKAAGCWSISYGVESGDQQVLDNMKKNVSLDQIKQALQWTREAGISPKAFFMVGSPGDTLQTIRKTTQFALDLPLDYFQMSYFVPLPGTEIYTNWQKYGTFEDDWEKINIWNPIFIAHGLSREILERESMRAFRKFYLRPHIIWMNIKRAFRTRYVIKHVQDAFRFLGFLAKG